MYHYISTIQNLDQFLFNFFLWEMHIGGMSSKWANMRLNWAKEFKPNESSMIILHQTQIVIAALLGRNMLSKSVCPEKGPCFIAFAHLNCSSVDEAAKGRGFLHFFVLFLSINIYLLWTRFSVWRSSRRTFLGWGKNPLWRNCWGTVDSMDRLLLSKRVNVVCVFVQVCNPTSKAMKTTKSKISLNTSDDLSHQSLQTCTYEVLSVVGS